MSSQSVNLWLRMTRVHAQDFGAVLAFGCEDLISRRVQQVEIASSSSFFPGFSLYCIDVWILMRFVWIGCSVLDRRELTCESVCDGACSSRPSWETAGRMLKSSGTLGCGLPRLVLLVTFGALTELRSAASFLPYTSKVALDDYLGSVSWRERSSSVLLYVSVSLSSK